MREDKHRDESEDILTNSSINSKGNTNKVYRKKHIQNK